jgi:hypothetical protein
MPGKASGTTRAGARNPAHRALVAGLLLVVAGLAPETWAGVAMTVTVLAAGAALLVHASRSVDWSVRHTAAVAIGALLSRGTLAFFYYPVVGETSAVPKYAHNVTMLAVVVALGWLALRSRGRAADTAAAGPYRTGPR